MKHRQAIAFDESTGNVHPVSSPQEKTPTEKLKSETFFSPEYRQVMIRLIEDHLATGGTAETFYDEIMYPEQHECACVAIRKYGDLLLRTRRPKLLAKVLNWKTSASLVNDGETIGKIGQIGGVSKQAIQQSSDSLDTILPNLRTLTRRSDKARKKMKARNSRKRLCG